VFHGNVGLKNSRKGLWATFCCFYISSFVALKNVIGYSEPMHKKGSCLFNALPIFRVVALSQMQQLGARQTFPCFDEPGLKATFDFILRHRSDLGYFAISNMPVISYEVKIHF